MADIRLQDVVKIYGVSKNQKKHRQLFFKKEKTALAGIGEIW